MPVSTRPLLQSINYEAYDDDDDDDDDDAAVVLDFPLGMKPERRLELVGSANRLACVVVDDHNIVLWNPSTRDAKELPKPEFSAKYIVPNDEPCLAFGLSYDSSADDYKVVRLTSYVTPILFIKTRGEVFSLKTNSWRRIQDYHPSICMLNWTGTFSNGSLHWLVNCGISQDKSNAIISFDLVTEKFEEVVPLPNHVVRMGTIPDLRVLGGCLSVLYRFDNNFEVWVMKEYGVKASWTKLATISCEKVPPSQGLPQYQIWLLPLCFSKSNVLMDVGGMALVMYDLKEETFRKLLIYGQS